jgi:hypothetical protein
MSEIRRQLPSSRGREITGRQAGGYLIFAKIFSISSRWKARMV